MPPPTVKMNIEKNRHVRLFAIPPRIRALAKVIHDVDRDQFPGLYRADGTVDPAELISLSAKMGIPVDDLMSSVSGLLKSSTQASPTNASQLSFSCKTDEYHMVPFPDDFINLGITVDVHEVPPTNPTGPRRWLSREELVDFEYAYNDYAQHLRGVDMATLARTGMTELITLSTSIDREAVYTNLTMSKELDAVYHTHNFLLGLVMKEATTRQQNVFGIFVSSITEILKRILSIVISQAPGRKRQVFTTVGDGGSESASRRASLEASRATSEGTTPAPLSRRQSVVSADSRTSSPFEPTSIRTEVLTPVPPNMALAMNRRPSRRASVVTLQSGDTTDNASSPFSGASGSAHVEHSMVPQRKPSLTANRKKSLTSFMDKVCLQAAEAYQQDLSPEEELIMITELNSSLWFLTNHMEWFMSVSGAESVFDAAAHINDVSALEVWNQYVGRNSPACSAESFEPALSVFPEWAREPILKMLDFKQGGVVSVFSLLRVLKMWGPFLLLDRNLTRDLTHSMINLSETSESKALEMTLDKQPSGSFCLTISRRPGALDLVVMTNNGSVRTLQLDRDTGSWMINGVSREDFESPTDACSAFRRVFKFPLGETYEGVPRANIETHNDTFSVLHRACFQNNVAYVRKLILRGGAVLANSAVRDPSITTTFTWTPLLCAVNNPNGDPFEIAQLLLDNGADALYQDEATCTAIYFAIVNRYPKTLTTLLDHCKQRSIEPVSSSVTIPLFVALGAHFYNVSDLDNFRLCDSMPSVEVVVRVLNASRNWDVIKAAIQILQTKLIGENINPRHNDNATWNFGGFESPTLTEEETVTEEALIRHHTLQLSNNIHNRQAAQDCLKALYRHSFFLSCQHLKASLEGGGNAVESKSLL